MFHRNGECLGAVGCGYDAAVAIGLFLIRVVLLYHTAVVAVKLLIPLDRTEIGGLQEGCGHGVRGMRNEERGMRNEESKVFAIVKHSHHPSDDAALRNKAEMARVGRILLVEGFQPVIVGFGAVDEAWH